MERTSAWIEIGWWAAARGLSAGEAPGLRAVPSRAATRVGVASRRGRHHPHRRRRARRRSWDPVRPPAGGLRGRGRPVGRGGPRSRHQPGTGSRGPRRPPAGHRRLRGAAPGPCGRREDADPRAHGARRRGRQGHRPRARRRRLPDEAVRPARADEPHQGPAPALVRRPRRCRRRPGHPASRPGHRPGAPAGPAGRPADQPDPDRVRDPPPPGVATRPRLHALASCSSCSATTRRSTRTRRPSTSTSAICATRSRTTRPCRRSS